MTSGAKISPPIGRTARAIVAAGGMLLLLTLAAAAQEPGPSAKPPANPPAREAYRPGMLDGVGLWFRDSVGRFNNNVEGARGSFGSLGERASGAAREAAGAAQDAADAAKDAADAVARLPAARVVDGRARCAAAANGAPDCRKAAEAVCKAKGFGSGASLDIQSAQKCPVRVWLSGRSPEPGDCETQSYVTRAMCQ